MAQRRRKQEEKRKLDEQIEEIKKRHGVDPVTQAETAGIINSTIRASRSNLETQQRKLEASKQTLNNYRSELRTAERELEKLGVKDATVAKHSFKIYVRGFRKVLEKICFIKLKKGQIYFMPNLQNMIMVIKVM